MICCLVGDPAGTAVAAGVLESVARACSPRVVPHSDQAVLFDVSGLSRAWGTPEVIARDVEQLAANHGITVRVAVTDTMTSAWVLAHARPGRTVVPAGGTRTALAPVPIGWLGSVFELDHSVSRVEAGRVKDTPVRRGRRAGRHYRVAPSPAEVTTPRPSPAHTAADRSLVAECRDRLTTLARWGIRTCGELALLPQSDILSRLGAVGVRLHQAASGEDVTPLVPRDEARVFVDRMALDWPVDGLEPLSFVLARQCERLSQELERADRGAVTIHTTLRLVTRDTHARSLALPAPLRDARVLRTLILLDLESHPPPAGIDAVEVRLEVTPGRILQGSLLSLAVPTPEDLSTLLARLGALMGDTRIGAPVALDTHDARQVALVPFRVPDGPLAARGSQIPIVTGSVSPWLRRFRLPVAARVTLAHGTPVTVYPAARDLAGGRVVECAGPWRTSGGWWTEDRAAWDRDEWDVELSGGGLYRLTRLRGTGQWEIEGSFD